MANEDKEKQTRMIIAAAIIIALLYLVGSVLWGYMNAFFAAIFVYVFLNPIYTWFRSHGIGKTTSGVISMLIGGVVIVIPLALVSGLLVSETMTFVSQTNTTQYFGVLNNGLIAMEKMFPQFNLRDTVKHEAIGIADQALDYFKGVILSIPENAGNFTLQLMVAMFVLYYLLVGEEDIKKIGEAILPFNKKNTDRLVKEFRNVTYSVIICTGLVGLVQAVPLTLIFMHYGVPAAIFWGFIAMVLACIPFLGVQLVWIPIAIVEALQHRYDAAIGITLVGLVVFGLENLRPLLQNKVGQIHPLVSLLGVIVGIQYFGLIGVLIGPLIISYSAMMAEMFKEEYLR